MKNETENQLKKYADDHLAKVNVENGYTYVRFGIIDCITEDLMKRIHKLLDLMRCKYCVYIVKRDQLHEDTFETIIDGCGLAGASIIRDFVKNNYTIIW